MSETDNSSAPETRSYSYEQAGVSIAAGNALVKAIGPLARTFNGGIGMVPVA